MLGPESKIAALSVAILFVAFGAYKIYDFDAPLHLITGEYLIKDVGIIEAA